MNLKKAKMIRKLLRIQVRHDNRVLPEDGLVYRNTAKIVGYDFPKDWLPANIARLSFARGPWFREMLKQGVPRYARQALNVPGSFRAIYRAAKKTIARA